MRHPTDSRKILIAYASFLTSCLLLVLTWILSSPSEPGSAVLLRLSLSRLILFTGFFLALLASIFVAVKAWRDGIWAQEKLEAWFGANRVSQMAFWLGCISFGAGWSGFFIPIYRYGWLEKYGVRLQPVVVFLLLGGIATLVVFYMRRKKIPWRGAVDEGVVRWTVKIFFVSLPVLALLLYTGFGLSSAEDFWYGAGVPVLAGQLLIAIAGGILFLWFESRFPFKRRDLVIFFLLFGVTAFLWAREPLQRGFSFVMPYAQADIFYPFYDAAGFDTASQLALIGQRISMFGGNYFERPLYLSLLVYLHVLFGQNYSLMTAGQAALYAVFPALIYLIGRSLHVRAVGFSAALIVLLRGLNSIRGSNMIDTAGPKMMLTDFPAAIGIALILLLMCEWLKRPKQKWHYALWIGGALGLTLMLRTNALLLLALIPLYALLVFPPYYKQWMISSLLVLAALIAITLPWELRNKSLGGQMYEPIVSKIIAVFNQRYMPAPSGSLPSDQGMEWLALKHTQVLSALYKQDVSQQPESNCDAPTCFIPNHFIHNVIASVLILPTSPTMDDLKHTVTTHPFWNFRWDGTFTASSLSVFLLNVFLIILGTVFAWRKRKLIGVTPLAVFMFYNLSNAFARTSGGRYVVPMDWIVTIYFLLGVLQVIVWFANTLGVTWKLEDETTETIETKTTPTMLPRTAIILCVLFGFGSLIPLSEKIYPPRYEGFDSAQIIAENRQALESNGLDFQELEAFLENKQSQVFVGRALYPRFYRREEGETAFYPNISLPFPRMAFTLIETKSHPIILPTPALQKLPHASDVLVIGCRQSLYIDALVVILLGEDHTVYMRSPRTELTCPLQQPVCDNNSNCK